MLPAMVQTQLLWTMAMRLLKVALLLLLLLLLQNQQQQQQRMLTVQWLMAQQLQLRMLMLHRTVQRLPARALLLFVDMVLMLQTQMWPVSLPNGQQPPPLTTQKKETLMIIHPASCGSILSLCGAVNPRGPTHCGAKARSRWRSRRRGSCC